MFLGLFLGAGISGFMLLGVVEAIHVFPVKSDYNPHLHRRMGPFNIDSHPRMKRFNDVPRGLVPEDGGYTHSPVA